MKSDLHLIIGSSGQIGSEMVRLLKADNQRVRMAKRGSTQTAEQVHLDLVTGDGLRNAFEGVERAFLMAPPPHADQYKILSPQIQEAKRRGLKKVVLLSAMGANAVETSPLRRAEIDLEKSGLNYNIVRPNWFMQNFITFWVQGIREHGKIFLPAGSAKTSFIDTLDIAAVVKYLLSTDTLNNQAFDLTGPESLDHTQIANSISRVTKRQVEYVDIEPVELKKSLLGVGLPEDYTEFLLLIMSFLKQGYNAGVNSNVIQILGRGPRTFDQFAKENQTAWI